MSWIANDWLYSIIVGFIIFFIAYLWTDKIIAFLIKKSLGQREEIIAILDKMFIETDYRKTTLTLLLLSFGLGALVFIAVWPKVLIGFILGTIITIVGWTIPKYVVQALFNRRCDQFVNQMVDGMTIMANGIKSGLSVPQCMERVVENMGNPISQEFNLVLSQIRIGRSVEEALNDLGERIPRPDVQMFVTAINILKETGGNLAETFATITMTVRERQKVEKKIQALTAQGLMQGFIITMVPFVLLVVFFVIDPKYIMPMFNTVLGVVFLLIVLILQFIGGLMIRKIVKIQV